MPCCWVLLAPCWPWVLLYAPETGVLCLHWLCRRMDHTLLCPCLGGHFMKDMGLPWHTHWLEVSYSPGWLESERGWTTSQDMFLKEKTGMCSVLARNRDLLGSRSGANLDPKTEISVCRPGSTSVLTICIVEPLGPNAISFWNRSSEEPDPPNTLQRELQCPTTVSAMQPLQRLTPESEAKIAPN